MRKQVQEIIKKSIRIITKDSLKDLEIIKIKQR